MRFASVWVGPVAAVGALCLAVTVAVTSSQSGATRAVDGVCRSLAAPTSFAPVPGDVLERTAETDQAILDHLTTPSVDRAAAARTALVRETPDAPTRWVGQFAACLVDYYSNHVLTGPVPALLLYRQQQHPLEHCFGSSCPRHPPTYAVDCAMLLDADTMQTLRVEGCWGFRNE